ALSVARALSITADDALELAERWREISDRPIFEAQAPQIAAIRAEQDLLIEQYDELLAILDHLNSIGAGDSLQAKVIRGQLEDLGNQIAANSRETIELERNAVSAADALA